MKKPIETVAGIFLFIMLAFLIPIVGPFFLTMFSIVFTMVMAGFAMLLPLIFMILPFAALFGVIFIVVWFLNSIGIIPDCALEYDDCDDGDD